METIEKEMLPLCKYAEGFFVERFFSNGIHLDKLLSAVVIG